MTEATIDPLYFTLGAMGFYGQIRLPSSFKMRLSFARAAARVWGRPVLETPLKDDGPQDEFKLVQLVARAARVLGGYKIYGVESLEFSKKGERTTTLTRIAYFGRYSEDTAKQLIEMVKSSNQPIVSTVLDRPYHYGPFSARSPEGDMLVKRPLNGKIRRLRRDWLMKGLKSGFPTAQL